MKCRKCKEVMKDAPIGFDSFSFLNQIKMMYCNNEKCEHFGFVTVAGLPDDNTPASQDKE